MLKMYGRTMRPTKLPEPLMADLYGINWQLAEEAIKISL